MRIIMLVLVLLGFWLALSGHYSAWLVGSGIVAAIAIGLYSRISSAGDREGFPLELSLRGALYWPWLIGEIVKSALNVTRIILSPRLPISPTLVRVKAQQNSAVGLTTYANSITLTPGTISVEISEYNREIWVHAIERSGAEGFEDDEMNARVAWFEKAPV